MTFSRFQGESSLVITPRIKRLILSFCISFLEIETSVELIDEIIIANGRVQAVDFDELGDFGDVKFSCGMCQQ